MATGPLTQVSDIVVPAVFGPYMQVLTEIKSRLVQAGTVATAPVLDGFLAAGGLTYNMPAFKDLDEDPDRVSTDDPADIVAISESAGSPALPAAFTDAIPYKIETLTEVGVRLSRNGSWASADLSACLAGADPLQAIAQRVSSWRVRRQEDLFISTWQGVSKDNGVNDSGDYANDIAGANGSSYVPGVTDFSAEAFLDALVTMGDSQEDLGMVMVHSIVYNRMQKNNLIDFIPDSMGVVHIPTFLGRRVVVDDRMPNGTSAVLAAGTAAEAGVYETWIFGGGSTQLGRGMPVVGTEIERAAASGNGGGSETLFSRWEWLMHPVGHAYTGATPDGGPTNTVINAATSWNRVYGERKQVKFARLVSRES